MSAVPYTAGDAVAWSGGELLRGEASTRFDGTSIDSRTVGAGDLFVAIAGPNHDGHGFLEAALARGAAGLAVERERDLPAGLPRDAVVVGVADTTRALGALAHGHRGGFPGPVVAITGSNGKTSTKEMCAAAMEAAAPCLKNRGNLNNEYGLPLTLLSREPEHETVVVELGMNHRGEIAVLAEIAAPTIGVLTNVGTAHIEHLGSQDEIALEKGDLVAALPTDGTAVLNGDDPRASAQAARTEARVVRFGRSADADVRPEKVRECEGGFAFDLVTPWGSRAIEVAGLGDVALSNALAASAAALAAGISLDELATGLSRYEPASGRLERRALAGGVVLIDDTYNANPESMEVALRHLASRSGGRRLAVLGDMGELGDAAESAHLEAGALAATLGIDGLFLLGERAGEVARGARDAGMEAARIHGGRDHEELVARVLEVLADGDSVLVKGSRSMRMERVAHAIAERRR